MGLPISTVNISLRTAGATRAGFGVPCFITPHKGSFSRTLTLTSADSALDYFSESHPAYKFVAGVYTNSPAPAKVIIARHNTTSVTLTPEDASAGKVYKVTVQEESGAKITASYTATGTEVASDIVTALQGDLATLTQVSISGTDTLIIADDTDVAVVTGIVGMTEIYASSSESAAQVMTSVREENDTFYFVGSSDHTETFVLGLAAVVETLEKMYFVSLQTAEMLTTPYSVSGTSIAAKLKALNYSNTAVMWDEAADSILCEANWVGSNAPFSPDESAVVWDGLPLAGVDVAKNVEGNEVTATQQGYLDTYNASYVVTTSLGPRLLGGKTVNGTWIDEVRTKHCISARVRETLDTLLMNQKGSKVVGGKKGVLKCVAEVQKALTPFTKSNALSSFSVSSENAVLDPVTRILSNLTFEARLAGAIIRVVVNGVLVNEEA